MLAPASSAIRPSDNMFARCAAACDRLAGPLVTASSEGEPSGSLFALAPKADAGAPCTAPPLGAAVECRNQSTPKQRRCAVFSELDRLRTYPAPSGESSLRGTAKARSWRRGARGQRYTCTRPPWGDSGLGHRQSGTRRESGRLSCHQQSLRPGTDTAAPSRLLNRSGRLPSYLYG